MNVKDSSNVPVTAKLDELLQEGDSSARPYSVLTGHNLGSNTLLMCIPMHQFWEISEVANERNIESTQGYAMQPVAQRKLDPNHAKKLATYILKGVFASLAIKYKSSGDALPARFREIQELMGPQPYLAIQPITANIRECRLGGSDLRVERSQDGKITVYLSDRHVLWVVDGQHRRKAMDMVFEYMKSILANHRYPRKPDIFSSGDETTDLDADVLKVWADAYEIARGRCKVMCEVHLGLDADQERQLFHDLNNLSKKIESGLAFKFDNSNPVNLFIKHELVDNGIIDVVDRDVTDWHADTGALSRKDLIAINAILFLNKTNISGAAHEIVNQRRDVALKFWETVAGIDGFGETGSKKKTVAAQPVVLKALAKLAYTFAFSRDASNDHLRALIEGINKIDFTHKNPIWRYYLWTEEQRAVSLPGLKEYLPSSEDGANRDIGGFDNKEEVFRFGAKHNDIYPIIADMIRWMLKLPSRHAVTMIENF